VSPRPCQPVARGPPLDHHSSRRPFQTRVALAQFPIQESATGQRPAWIIPHTRLHWQPQRLSIFKPPPPPWPGMLPRRMIRGHHLGLGPGQVRQTPAEPPARHPPDATRMSSPQATWVPPPDGQPSGPDRVMAQGAGHRSSHQALQAVSTTPPTSRTGRPTRSRPSSWRSHQSSTPTPAMQWKKEPLEVR
jgi:hypothetical protein